MGHPVLGLPLGSAVSGAQTAVPTKHPKDMPSSVIRAMRYAPSLETLEIDFRADRGLYRYFDVAPEEWLAFHTAPSKGTYLNEVFKAKNYRFAKITDGSWLSDTALEIWE
ncbi:KTSC domain-containing protein [Terriglobus saanensis]|nr:KTSC domain-containing protein [Terriglobus saanensis]